MGARSYEHLMNSFSRRYNDTLRHVQAFTFSIVIYYHHHQNQLSMFSYCHFSLHGAISEINMSCTLPNFPFHVTQILLRIPSLPYISDER
jgi:hypothetical protein